MADARRPASELTRATNHALMAGVRLAGRRRAAGAPIGGRAGGLARTVAGSAVGRRSIQIEEEDDTPRPFLNI